MAICFKYKTMQQYTKQGILSLVKVTQEQRVEAQWPAPGLILSQRMSQVFHKYLPPIFIYETLEKIFVFVSSFTNIYLQSSFVKN